jgi:hypothetical protein
LRPRTREIKSLVNKAVHSAAATQDTAALGALSALRAI